MLEKKITLMLSTGNQLAFIVSCDLKLPLKASNTSLIENAHIADPPIELVGVVKTPYTISPYVL